MSSTAQTRVISPVRVVTTADDALVITQRIGNAGGGCFGVLWMVGWSVGVWRMVPQALAEPSAPSLAGAALMVAVWLAAAVVIAWSFAAIDELRVTRWEIRYARRLWLALRRREIPVTNLSYLGLEPDADAGASTDDQRNLAIVIRSHDHTIRFGQGLPPVLLQSLVSLIRQRLPDQVLSRTAVGSADADRALVASIDAKAAVAAQSRGGIIGQAVSWVVALVWFCGGVVWIVATVGLAASVARNFSWSGLLIMIPVGGIAVFFLFVLYAIVVGTASALLGLFRQRQR